MVRRFWIAAAVMAYAGSCFAQLLPLPGGASAMAEVANDLTNVTVTVTNADGSSKAETFPLVETIRESRESMSDDYNFDGITDFAITTLDDGQGVSYHYDIFVYDPVAKHFTPLALPQGAQCDGGFSDVKVDKKAKMLTSSCRGAGWHQDHFVFKNGVLTLLKSKR